MSIPLQFGLFWSGEKMSYLRYLTFKSLRHFHPDSKISLYVSEYTPTEVKWWAEAQDFQSGFDYEDFMPNLKDLNVEIIKIDTFTKYLPNFQSDFFRWWYLKEFGGFYLDTDQIIIKNFSSLPLDSNLIYSQYETISCGRYAPVGVIGASKDSKIVSSVNKHLLNFYKKDEYNCIGPDMFKNVLAQMSEPNMFNAPPHYFYPINESWLITDALADKIKISEETFAFHWFGGNPISQRFNNVFTREFAMQNEDTLSSLVKKFNW